MQCSGNWIRNTWWIPKAIIYSRCFIYNNASCRVFISTCMPFIGRNVLSHLWNWTAPSSKFTWEGVSRYYWRKNIIVPHFPLLFFFSLPLLEDPAVKSLFSFAGLLWFAEFGKDWKLFFSPWYCSAVWAWGCCFAITSAAEYHKIRTAQTGNDLQGSSGSTFHGKGILDDII